MVPFSLQLENPASPLFQQSWAHVEFWSLSPIAKALNKIILDDFMLSGVIFALTQALGTLQE